MNICDICSNHSSHQVISFSNLGMTNNELKEKEILMKNFDENLRKMEVIKRNIKSFLIKLNLLILIHQFLKMIQKIIL